MKTVSGALILFFIMAAGLTAQNGGRQIELKEVIDGAFRQSSYVGEMRSMPDGEHYTAMNRERSMILKYSYRTGLPVDTIFDAKKARECGFDTFDGYEIAASGHRILIRRETEQLYRRSSKARVFDYDVRRNYVKSMTDGDEKIMIPTFSPDGRMCAFVKGNNIWIRKFDFDTEVQVTRDGELNRVLNGVTDWVYEEEFSVTRLMAWSPDSEVLAFVRSDESAVPTFSMAMYGDSTYPTATSFKYPKPGEANSTVSVHAYIVQTRETKPLQVPAEGDFYIPRIDFTSNSDQLAVMTLNRNQNVFNMYYVNPRSGVSRLILREENRRYFDSDFISTISFNRNGFIRLSETDGYTHIYMHSPTGTVQRQVTKGPWDVTRLHGYDESTRTVYYESAEESPLRRSVYKIDEKGVKTRLSKSDGTNSATFSSSFAYYLGRHSSISSPLTVTLYETKTGNAVRTLIDNAALRTKLAEYSFGRKEFTTIVTASGVELNGWVLKPQGMEAGKRYPLLMIQYSGPNSQQATDGFGFDWEYYLSARGFVVACFDGRGTGARGEEFRKCTYMKMGELESRDQAEAARELAKLPFVDGKRMAIWGWSFGGYNTLMAMSTGNGTFAAGIAVAPPTDWRFYDTVYTERFMRTPKENKAGYDATSPILLADRLRGKLLLVHGTADDNVHFTQSIIYAEALVQAGKQFEMQFYKDRNHGIGGGKTRLHLYTRMAEFLFNNL
ncbi:MAG: S9 family peptidase [Tannerellaceae bacterium]|nr:S9 family peptidase [Tannerellaceae bacterium]